MGIYNGLFKKSKGSLGGVTFRGVNGQTVTSEKITKTTNPRTEAQMKQRVQLANLVSTYRLLQRSNLKGFQFKKKTQSDYNAFVANNINIVKCYLTKQEAAAQACVPAPYLFSQGSLPSIVVSQDSGTSRYVTSISLASLDTLMEGSDVKPIDVPIGILSACIIKDNAGWQEGDQLSYISFRQITDESSGFPYGSLYRSDIVLNLNDPRKVGDVIDPLGFDIFNHFLAHDASKIQGAFAWVHSRNVSGSLQVSTQRFVVYNNTYNSHSTEDYLNKAIRSYSDPSFVFLDAKDSLKQGEPVPTTTYDVKEISISYTDGSHPVIPQPYYNLEADKMESGFSFWIDLNSIPTVVPTEMRATFVVDGVLQSITASNVEWTESVKRIIGKYSALTASDIQLVSLFLSNVQIL